MPWNAGVFIRSNGTYSGADVWADDEANAFDIESGRHDIHDQDLGNGINATLNRNGENAMAADVKMGGNKVTNLAAGVAATDAVTKAQLDAGTLPVGTAQSQTVRWTGSVWEETSDLSVTSDGDVGIGTTTPETILNVSGVTDAGASVAVDAYGSINSTVQIRSAAGTSGSPTASQDADSLGALVFKGYGTTGFPNASAAITSAAQENFTDSTFAANLQFRTTPSGGANTVRMTVTEDGVINIANIPTSSDDLNSGDLWSDAGTIKIIP